MSEEAGVHSGLVALNLGTPHHVAVADAVHSRDGTDRLYAAATGLDSSLSILLGVGPVLLDEGYARGDTQCNSIAHVALVLLSGAFEQAESLFDVAVNLLIDVSHGRTGLSLCFFRGWLGVDRSAGLVFVSLVGAGKPLCQLEVAVGTHGIGLTEHVMDVFRSTAHRLFSCDDVVGVGNPCVESIPEVIAAPRTAGETALHVVGSVEPEPARTLRTHDEVVAHYLGGEAVGRNTEALVGVTCR